ncbi:UNVERIFIED_CONTAM: hypothetical protein FKN15_029539 [Acipenser sinensis]
MPEVIALMWNAKCQSWIGGDVIELAIAGGVTEGIIEDVTRRLNTKRYKPAPNPDCTALLFHKVLSFTTPAQEDSLSGEVTESVLCVSY